MDHIPKRLTPTQQKHQKTSSRNLSACGGMKRRIVQQGSLFRTACRAGAVRALCRWAAGNSPHGRGHDREARGLAVDQRLAQDPRADPEDQVVLGLACAEEVTRVREEVAGALVS